MQSRFPWKRLMCAEAGVLQQQELPLAYLLERTFHSCLILILKLVLVTDHHKRVGDSQLEDKRHR